MVDLLNHNIRRRLDTYLYILCLGVLQRVVVFISKSRIRIIYHWSELWRSLLSFIKFLATYVDDLKSSTGLDALLNTLIQLIALSLSKGESFLPDPSSYDDLFYKVVEAGAILTSFRDVYKLAKHSNMSILIGVSSHYDDLLKQQHADKSRSHNLRPADVHRIIRQGYETLSIESKEGLDEFERFREVDHRSVLKRVVRVAVEDVKVLVAEK